MSSSGIYKIQSNKNPSLFYIGSSRTLNRRKNAHWRELKLGIHHNKKLQNYCNKHGIGDFSFIIMELCLPPFLIEREQYYLDVLKPYFNLRLIAETGRGIPMSEGQKIKIGIANKGRIVTEETREKQRIAHLGIHPSEESIRKNREANSGEKNAFFGKQHKPESIQKMKDAKKGKYIKENNSFWGKHHKKESILQMIEKCKGHHWSPDTEFKKGMVQSRDIIEKKTAKLKKPVIQFSLNRDFVKRWNGISDIIGDTFKRTAISNCCNKKKESYRGYIWMFESDYEIEKLHNPNTNPN